MAGLFGWGDMTRDFIVAMWRKWKGMPAPNVMLGNHIIATTDRFKFSRMVAGDAVQVSNVSTFTIGGERYHLLITTDAPTTPNQEPPQ